VKDGFELAFSEMSTHFRPSKNCWTEMFQVENTLPLSNAILIAFYLEEHTN
jgi:hypothetical protein